METGLREAFISTILTPCSGLTKGFGLRCEAGEEGKGGPSGPGSLGRGKEGLKFAGHLLRARHRAGIFCHCFLLPDNLRGKGYRAHFIDEETEKSKHRLKVTQPGNDGAGLQNKPP